MITCKLGEKTYSVDHISGRALREIDPALKMYAFVTRITEQSLKGEAVDKDAASVKVNEALDVLVKWFCIVFGNQFTPDEFYDQYPVDRVMVDIPLTLMAVVNQTTNVLNEFPTKPTTEEQQQDFLRALREAVTEG